MRTIHADLKTAQEAASTTPYIYMSINSVDYGTDNRLISFEWIEEPYRDSAIIVLDNSDRALDPGTLDLRGYPFFIGTGYNTTSGNRYCGDGSGTDGTPTLWVKSQNAVSMEGRAICILECEGMWAMLREIKYLAVGDAPYYDTPFGGVESVREIIILALAEASMTLNATYTDDSIIDALKPYFTVNNPPFESLATLLYRLILMTKQYYRPEASLVFKLVYPQEADSVDETYYSDQAPQFLEYVEKRNLLVPNDIKIYWGANDDGTWDEDNLALPGSAVDQASIDAYTRVREVFLAPDLTTQADADLRASAILSRYKSETLAGRLVLPYHDCSVELYDRVQINDFRGT